MPAWFVDTVDSSPQYWQTIRSFEDPDFVTVSSMKVWTALGQELEPPLRNPDQLNDDHIPELYCFAHPGRLAGRVNVCNTVLAMTTTFAPKGSPTSESSSWPPRSEYLQRRIVQRWAAVCKNAQTHVSVCRMLCGVGLTERLRPCPRRETHSYVNKER
jgi:hypothetical protein